MSTGWTFSVEVLGAIASIVVILEWCGIRPKGLSRGLIMPLSQKWKLVMMLAVVAISLGFSIKGYFNSLHPRIIEKTITVTEPYEFAWRGDNPPSKHVIGRHFENERVTLDDTSYIECTFKNVTFVYNGTAPFTLKDISTKGYDIASDNPSLNAMGHLLYGFDLLKIPVLMRDTGRPPLNIEPALRPKQRP